MKLGEVAKLLNARLVCGEKFIDREITHVFASDLMSDVRMQLFMVRASGIL
jgi:hypothetical protein